jgi:hypothetical protein
LAAEINALLTDCDVQLQADGSPTEDTQLQRWPRFAPPPKRLHIDCTQQEPAGSFHPLIAFLARCMHQELAVHMLRDVQDLRLDVSAQGWCSRDVGGVMCLPYPCACRDVKQLQRRQTAGFTIAATWQEAIPSAAAACWQRCALMWPALSCVRI